MNSTEHDKIQQTEEAGNGKSFADRHPSRAQGSHAESAKPHGKGLVNGALLDTLEWGTSVFNVPPGKHRLYNAIGLTAGFHVGARMMEAVTGQSLLTGKTILEKDMSAWARPLHRNLKSNDLLMKYDRDPGANPKDKWMFVAHAIVPGIIGMLGAAAGSSLFFKKRDDALCHPEYLDDYVDEAAMVQSRPWQKMSALSSMFGSASGFQWLPFPNYGINIGSRFTLASGRKVAAPGLGKIWSDNDTIYPFAPPALLTHMIKYAVNNPDHTPQQFEAMADGILKPLFKNITPEQLQAFVGEIHAVRDKFLREGGVPEELKAQCEKELKQHFRGMGLEDTLLKIGLNPLEAKIDANGLSGKIANTLGAEKGIKKLEKEFTEKFKKRHEHQPEFTGISR